MRRDPKGRVVAEVGHGLGRAVQSGSASTRGAVGVYVDGSVSRAISRLSRAVPGSRVQRQKMDAWREQQRSPYGRIPDSVRDTEVGR